ncbi:helix-turn-helix transcriptional regulator [Sphingomonas sp. BE137]|uniref:helix-turn-helix transcriptional regulator n=1 Tax=Sphingomonas sp. BE137 TaxID=2817844 RepID=UPI001AE2B96C|nr:helix-turn-helix transcriptional regulator [Sphingomonas sp. BE137]MDR6850331.1 phage repressor protein C with HTH and peptisase S24 domain [Sphingomonas sp. BE137]
MSDSTWKMTDRIEERLNALGLSDRKASLAAVGKTDLIRDIRRGRAPSAVRLAALATVLETTSEYLLGETENPANGSAEGIRALVPPPQEMAQDIPVYGTALGSSEEMGGQYDGGVAIEQTELNTGEVVDRFRRPPNLINRRDIYGLYVAGDSMEPAYESGQGVLVDPKRPAASRDYVVVYLRDKHDSGLSSGVLIKRLVRRSASYIELQQFNPPTVFRLEASQYQAVHRVMPWDEAFGI